MTVYEFKLIREEKSIKPNLNSRQQEKEDERVYKDTKLYSDELVTEKILLENINYLYGDGFIKLDSENIRCQWMGVKIDYDKNGLIYITYVTIYVNEVEVEES